MDARQTVSDRLLRRFTRDSREFRKRMSHLFKHIFVVFRHYVIYDDDNGLNGGGGGVTHLRDDSFSLPANLVGNGTEKVKLLEYRHHKKRNQAHSVVGTGNYMAPEVIKKIGTRLIRP